VLPRTCRLTSYGLPSSVGFHRALGRGSLFVAMARCSDVIE
jgi:hypothetical protein